MEADPVFQFTEAPEYFLGNPLSEHARWLTWSARARRLLDRFFEEEADLPTPSLIRLRGGSKYEKTYSIPLEVLRKLKCYRGMMQIAKAMLQVVPREEVFLFRDLLNEEFGGEQFGKFLAAIRELMVLNTGQIDAALYAPLSRIGPQVDDFPLHADLYLQDILWNVFEQVPADGSGAARLLPVRIFRELLKRTRVPPKDAATLLGCLDGNSDEDRFEMFFDLLHANNASWAGRLVERMTSHQYLVQLKYGQGYLVNDRSWLHGREAPTGGVTVRRVHRLIYCGPQNSLARKSSQSGKKMSGYVRASR